MADTITQFFEDLDRRGYEPLLAKMSGTLRVDLHEGAQTTHWLLTVDRGRIGVTQEERTADTEVRTSPDVFAQLVTGRENLIAATLRGDLTATGDARLAVQVERLLPSPPDARGPRRVFAKESR